MGKRREASRPELMELSEWRTWETLAAIRIASARFVSQSHDFYLSVTLSAPNTNWKVDYRTALVGRMLLVAFHANRLNADWNAAKEWEVSQILKLPAGLEAAFEVHCAAISNSSIGLHGVEVQVAQHTIALRSSGKMTVSANWGWVEGCITVPLV